MNKITPEMLQRVENFDVPWNYTEGHFVVLRPLDDILWIESVITGTLSPGLVDGMHKHAGRVAVIERIVNTNHITPHKFVSWIELKEPNEIEANMIMNHAPAFTELADSDVQSWTWFTPWIYPFLSRLPKTFSLWSPKGAHNAFV